MNNHPLAGVYAAAVTPLKADFTPNLEAIPPLLDFYARRGCHGALLLGTTGEGPSFSPSERGTIFQAGVKVREDHPNFRLLAGTGTPSLDETITLNKTAFDLGFDGVVVLPPFYFRDASEDGLFAWFSNVIEGSVPRNGIFMGYHFPAVSGVALDITLLTRLRDSFPNQFEGVKDSSGDLNHAQTLIRKLENCAILVGNDRLLSPALEAGGAGCITALANLVSPKLREIWEALQREETAVEIQKKVDAAREVLDGLKPFPASIKGLLAEVYGFPHWPVKPPLAPFGEEMIKKAAERFRGLV